MRGRVPGTGFPHVLGVCGEYHICTSVTGTVSELRSLPGTGLLQDELRGFFPGARHQSGRSESSGPSFVAESLFSLSASL